ncbi:FAD:protein FMN transferase [Thalassotalea euphylliae]|nr:FAD:protein FMN transferase [Thalassotalea euphylliae]
MTVPCQLTLVGKCQQQLERVAKLVEANTQRLAKKYNFYQADSWLNQTINQRKMSSVNLDKETAQVLSQVHQLSQATNSLFDITVGTVKALAQQAPELSYQALFSRCQPAMGIEVWSLDGPLLTFCCADTQLDLGGVIKEYAVDQAALICRQQGVEGGLINFGGDIISWGLKSDGNQFRIALANPVEQGQIVCTLPLYNQAFTTSGHSERAFFCGQQSRSHILARDGVSRQVLSASVLSHSVLLSGIYSTALAIEPMLVIPRTIASLFVDQELQVRQGADFIC